MTVGTQVAEKMANPIAVARIELEQMEGQFKAALPAHIPAERFARVLMTALQNNPDLFKCDRRSFWNAAMKAAQDGLLPDGREGAIIPYGSQAQWLPMIAGLRKKVRNSGEIATWDAQVVFEKDAFKFQLGDEPFIHHEPNLDADPGKVVAAYSIAVLKSGEKSREVMSVAQIEKVRSRSKAKNNGPWVTDYSEMCRKTVARRHSKMLPMSTDLDDLIRRDDELYDLDGARAEAAANNGGRPQSIADKLDALAQVPSSPAIAPEAENGNGAAAGSGSATSGGEASQTASPSDASPATTKQEASPQSAAAQPSDTASKAAPAEQVGTQAPVQSGAAEADKWPKGQEPKTEREYVRYTRHGWFAEIGETITVEEAQAKWKADKTFRNRVGVSEEVRDELKVEFDRIIAAAKKAG